MIGWILAGAALAILGTLTVIDEIRDDRAVRRYQRERDDRLRLLIGDIHKSR